MGPLPTQAPPLSLLRNVGVLTSFPPALALPTVANTGAAAWYCRRVYAVAIANGNAGSAVITVACKRSAAAVSDAQVLSSSI